VAVTTAKVCGPGGLAGSVIAVDVRLLTLLRFAGVRVSRTTQYHEATPRGCDELSLQCPETTLNR